MNASLALKIVSIAIKNRKLDRKCNTYHINLLDFYN
jgi:hypothetical protein